MKTDAHDKPVALQVLEAEIAALKSRLDVAEDVLRELVACYEKLNTSEP